MNKEDSGKDQYVGHFQTNLGTLMGSSKQKLNKELILDENNIAKKKEDDHSDNEKAKKKEKVPRIVVRAESESDSNNEITIELSAIL